MEKPRLREGKLPAGHMAGKWQSQDGNTGFLSSFLPWSSSSYLYVYTGYISFDRFHCFTNRDMFIFL